MTLSRQVRRQLARATRPRRFFEVSPHGNRATRRERAALVGRKNLSPVKQARLRQLLRAV